MMIEHTADERLSEGVTILFDIAMEDAQHFIRQFEKCDCGLGNFGDWLKHLVEICLPLEKNSDTLPVEQLIAFQRVIEKFNQRLWLAVEEARARKETIH